MKKTMLLLSLLSFALPLVSGGLIGDESTITGLKKVKVMVEFAGTPGSQKAEWNKASRSIESAIRDELSRMGVESAGSEKNDYLVCQVTLAQSEGLKVAAGKADLTLIRVGNIKPSVTKIEVISPVIVWREELVFAEKDYATLRSKLTGYMKTLVKDFAKEYKEAKKVVKKRK